MEPETPLIGELIGGLFGALGGLGGGDGLPPASVIPNLKPPAILVENVETRPVRLSVPGRLIDVVQDEVTAQPTIDPSIGLPVLLLSFSGNAAEDLAAITSVHVGQPMELSVCGMVITRPIIQAPIVGGEVMLTGDFTFEQVQMMALAVNGDIACSALTEMDPDLGQ